MSQNFNPSVVDSLLLNDWVGRDQVDKIREHMDQADRGAITSALNFAITLQRPDIIKLLWGRAATINVLRTVMREGREDLVRHILAENTEPEQQMELANAARMAMSDFINHNIGQRHAEAQAAYPLIVLLLEHITDPKAITHGQLLLRAAEMEDEDICQRMLPRCSDHDIGTAMMGLSQTGNVSMWRLLDQHMTNKTRRPISYLMEKCIEYDKHPQLFNVMLEQANEAEKAKGAEIAARHNKWDKAKRIWGLMDNPPLWSRLETVCMALSRNNVKMAAHFLGDLSFGQRTFMPEPEVFLADNWRQPANLLHRQALTFVLSKTEPSTPMINYWARAFQKQHRVLLDDVMNWSMEHRDQQSYQQDTVDFLTKQLVMHRMALDDRQTMNFLDFFGPRRVLTALNEMSGVTVDQDSMLYRSAVAMTERDQLREHTSDEELPDRPKRKI